MRELFRLSEDEAALVQFYRMLPDDAKAAILAMAMLHSEQVAERAENVVSFARAILSV